MRSVESFLDGILVEPFLCPVRRFFMFGLLAVIVSSVMLTLFIIGQRPDRYRDVAPFIRDTLIFLALYQKDYNSVAFPHSYAPSLEALMAGVYPELGFPRDVGHTLTRPVVIDGTVPALPKSLAAGHAYGYRFDLVGGALLEFEHNGKPSRSYWAWSATAWPIDYTKGKESYYIDVFEVIVSEDTGGKPIESMNEVRED